MKIPGGARVGLCAHVPIYPATGDGMILEVTTDEGKIVVLVCKPCWVKYAADGDIAARVTRQIVTGRDGWDVKVEMEAAS